MKLLITIVQDQDLTKLLEQLSKNSFDATKLASTGGFLRQGNTTLLIGVEDEQVDQVLDIIRNTCQERDRVMPVSAKNVAQEQARESVKVAIGRATVFIVNVERFEKV